MALYNKYNNEDILIRAVLVGLLELLNNEIQYTQVWGNSDEEIETIDVPWYYNQSGDERFMQDFFTHYADCTSARKIDGNLTDQIPRGVITYNGSSINAQRITSRYVQGRYIKEVNGQLESYASYLYSIPLVVQINCEVWVDRQITALKIEQIIREKFYKTLTYYTYYKGLRVGSTVGFPEDIVNEKNITYSFESDNKIKLTFTLEIETYQPVFDRTTEVKTTSRINAFTYNLYPASEKDKLNSIEITTPVEGAIIPKGIPVWIEWIANSRGRIINKVNIQWSNHSENDLDKIELGVPNYEYYIWNIPSTFTDFKEPYLIWEETDSISVVRTPIIKVIPDLSTNVIDASSFVIVDEGYFNTLGEDDASIYVQLEMKDDDGTVYYSYDNTIYANIKYNIVDSFTVDSSTDIEFPGTVDYKNIDIYVGTVYSEEIVGILSNIYIV